jgi:hypothetical protein
LTVTRDRFDCCGRFGSDDLSTSFHAYAIGKPELLLSERQKMGPFVEGTWQWNFAPFDPGPYLYEERSSFPQSSVWKRVAYMKRRPITFADLMDNLDDRSVEVIRGLADGGYGSTAVILILRRCPDYDVGEIRRAVQSNADDRLHDESPGATECAPTFH